ncbi:hypothetical protein GC163_03535 [bacterium]|nr:hypothetical protein [bacterium]
MESSEKLIAILAGILVLGVGTQWLAWRIRIPAILLLLAVGCTAGSLTGFLQPDVIFGDLLTPMVSLSVGLILFEGGLNLKFSELRDCWRSLLGLLTIGVVITWFAAASFGYLLLGLSPGVALVLGAVLTVTGPTVIGPLLRDIRPTGRVGVIAKWEGIVIDPIGATLTLLVFEAVQLQHQAELGSATITILIGLTKVSVIGVVVGGIAAALLVLMIKLFWIPDYLQNAMTLMFVVGAFACADAWHSEAGLLAVTVMGVILANQSFIDIHRMLEFKESLTVLLISVLFIVLSARVPLSSLASLTWRGPAFAMVMITVVRPISVWFATLGSKLKTAERLFLAWLAPRGIVAAAVSSVFAWRMGEEGAAIAPATFLVIFMTVTIYGLTASWVARRLGLSNPNAQGLLIAGATRLTRGIAAELKKAGFTVVLVDTQYHHIRKSRDLGLPAHFANILSELVTTEIDFGGLGRFLAATSNDEINTLAVARFREVFGRDKVYQLPKDHEVSDRFAATWEHRLIGRTLFDKRLTYDVIRLAFDRGAMIKVTPLSDTFDYAAYQAHYSGRAFPLIILDGKKLSIVTTDNAPTPKSGQQVLSLLLPEEMVQELHPVESDE